MALRVLVVDRDRTTFEVVTRAAAGLDVECEYLSESPLFPQTYEAFRPDVVIFEIMLPDFDGLEIIDWLTNARSASRLVIVSDERRRNVRSAIALAEAHGLTIRHLPKPLLDEMVRDMLS